MRVTRPVHLILFHTHKFIVSPLTKSVYQISGYQTVLCIGFEVFTEVVMKSIIFWYITWCSPLTATDVSKDRLHLLLATCLLAGFLLNLFHRPWRWRQYFPSKRRLTLNRLHGVISQKMIQFIVVYKLSLQVRFLYEHYTERLRVAVILTNASVVPPGKCLDCTPLSPRPLPSKPFPIYYPSIIPKFEAIHV
jgi:hypothetical protein